jgi:hypothetical protein
MLDQVSRAPPLTRAHPQPGPMRSLEVRWILPGQLGAAVAGWFARFPARVEAREDTYLVDPQPGGISVKFRQGMALELKVYQGSPGILEVTGRARGGQAWWTLGFEATGPASQLRTQLETAAALVFAQPLPGGMELAADHSQSYLQWLTGGQPPSAPGT